jgi:beta-ribofuranosylaminobenzene 5'-phosphate synthase
MTQPFLFELFRSLEDEAGPLSAPQRILLGTDGSVTNLLEVLTCSRVNVVTRAQEVNPADPSAADLLNVPVGDPVNYRVVDLVRSDTGEILLHAVSYTPLSRLEPGFRSDLMRADIPIGRILRTHRIEARREIREMAVVQADPALARTFGIHDGEPLLSRRYQIIHHDQPLIAIQESFPACRFTGERRVVVEAPSRLHLTLIDMNGSLGRVDGGVGITLSRPTTLLEARFAEEYSVRGGDASSRERVLRVSRALQERSGFGTAAFTLHRSIPSHVGLGSGTSLSLATAAALSRLAEQEESVPALARATGRGGTSGIGTAAFAGGGFLLDGGHSFGEGREKTDFRPSAASRGVAPARITARHPFPEEWRIVLAIPRLPPGASGEPEVDIFRTACPIPLAEIQELSHLVLVCLLPGVVERDLDLFGKAVNRIQEIGFKRVEIACQHARVSGLLDILRTSGAACAGMSSFGPAVYAITDTGAPEVARAAQEYLGEGGGDVIVTSGQNSGAHIRVEQEYA